MKQLLIAAALGAILLVALDARPDNRTREPGFRAGFGDDPPGAPTVAARGQQVRIGDVQHSRISDAKHSRNPEVDRTTDGADRGRPLFAVDPYGPDPARRRDADWGPGTDPLGRIQPASASGVHAASAGAARSPPPGAAYQPPAVDPSEVVLRYCSRCHSERNPRGSLNLESFDSENALAEAERTERMIRKLRAGMMPPPGARRPSGDTLTEVAIQLETALDEAATRAPNPGTRSFQRLNRAEYELAIRDLLALEIDAADWLPLDQMSENFDNHADAQLLSPTLLEAYLNAATEVSRMAVGDPDAPPVAVTHKNSEYASQHPWDHVPGTPAGTRGGMAVDHVFPADAEYEFVLTFSSGSNSRLEDVDVSIDGERVALVPFTRQGAGADGRGADGLATEPVFVRAGQRRVAAAFVRRAEGPYEDLIRPHDWSMAGGGSGGAGITTLPHLRDVVIRGPLNAIGISDTPSRDRIFTCRPTGEGSSRECAREIVGKIAERAYRRPLREGELAGLLRFYEDGLANGGFEIGIRSALEAVLASPHFVLRLEREPDGIGPGEAYRLGDLELASRLSFFLWGTLPDDALREAAVRGELGEAELLTQARRMLDDPRAEALATRFAAQWLRLQDLEKIRPDPNFYPNFDEHLAFDMRRETELFFTDMVRRNASALEVVTAHHTFLNERLARHYGIPGVAGSAFRRVEYPDGVPRMGLLGHGSVLVQTSLANRTSPVLRGKWVMEVLMGTPPPPPPPDVPDLEDTESAIEGKFLTTRERLELHSREPTCNSCHRFMDPIGLALDNFDVTGKVRNLERGRPLDTRGDFYDGTPISTPAELAEALMKRPVPLVRNFIENLMSYALGRRVEYFDQPTVRRIARETEAAGYPVRSLILGVVASDAFQMKTAGGAVTTASEPESSR